jgi:hypothetical protein
MEENQPMLPAPITAGVAELKIKAELTKDKLTLPQLQDRALKIVLNRDNLPVMRDLSADIAKGRKNTEVIHETGKKPYLEGGRAWDAAKKVVFGEFDRIEGMYKSYYTKELAAIAEEDRLQKLEKAQEEAILAGIEENLITFSNMVIAAVTKKALLDVEARINLEKSPMREKKYGKHHARAIARYDTVLLPIIRDQKERVAEIEKLNEQIAQAEANNDPDKLDELIAKVDVQSNQMLQNNAIVQEAALNQQSFPVVEAREILPGVKTKRTNFSYEIFDVEMAFRKSRDLLEIGIDSKKAKLVKDRLVEEGHFEGKDIVIVDGIKYIATRTMEAL